MKNLLITLLVFVFLYSGCCRERKLLGSYTYLGTQKSCIPYQSNQKIVFLKENTSDTVIFVAGSRVEQLDEEPCGPECCDYFQIEHVGISLKAAYPKFEFELGLNYPNDTANFGVSINQASRQFFFASPEKTCKSVVTQNRICYDSLEINHHWFYNIIEHSLPVQSNIILIDKILYNQSQGILQFHLSDSSTYSLIL